ncbi:TetR family transcriptional regulator [Nocardia sp. SYP-A9097]|uniref:TetR/AcrR family transcriptional regulator n=1 Tax=Nocardia sp. SYP-A9097 TaxID=2663237 RepID=UPI0013248CEE|nr:TetR/AcrR family transcriptional regulator [Nocardia sp. SYP-A9097]MRH89922.1 TetR family transcriptional regulator [Nocardia sp. SYP-A9097]
MPPEDRRRRRSRRLLSEAFVALVLERGFAAVKVEDIAERADVGRATFYTHYTDKDALFDEIVTDLVGRMQERLEPTLVASAEGFTGKPVLELFRHAAEERDAYRILLRGEGDGRALRRFVEDRTGAAAEIFEARAAANGTTLRIDGRVLARAWVGEMLAVMEWWLESEDRMSPEDVTAMLLNLSLRGRYWASGFDGEPQLHP